jgi:rod shape-determining protein MreD
MFHVEQTVRWQGGALRQQQGYPEAMTKRLGYVLGIVLAALVQARLLPELGLERAVNLPLVLLIVTASAERRSLALVAATVAGLTIDTVLLRPLGLTSLAMTAGVLVASQIRGAGDALLPKRFAALLFGLAASSATILVLSGGGSGRIGENAFALVVNLLTGGALAALGQRRRRGYQSDRVLRG